MWCFCCLQQAWKSHRGRANTESNTRKNISAHYDLSNALFELFLDPTMSYSSAYFATAEQPLEEAQKNKIEMLCRKAQVKQGMCVSSNGCVLSETRVCMCVRMMLM